MSAVDQFLANALVRRVTQPTQDVAGPLGQLPVVGGAFRRLNDAPLPVKLLLMQAMPGVQQAAQGQAFLDADQGISKATTGALAALAGSYLAHVANAQHALDPTMPGEEAIPQALQRSRAAFASAPGDNPLDWARAANEAGAKGNEFAFGLANAALDPLNFVGAGEGIAAARGFGKTADVLGAINQAQNAPVDLLANQAKRVVNPAVTALLAKARPAADLLAEDAAKAVPSTPVTQPALTPRADGGLHPELTPTRPTPPTPTPDSPLQAALPPESGVIPPHLLNTGLNADQRDLLDQLGQAVLSGDQGYVDNLRGLATEMYDIPEARVQAVLDQSYKALDQQRTAARLAAIEQSPYYSVFSYFNPKTGELIKKNPRTGETLQPAMFRLNGGKRHNANAEIWDWPNSGYDEVADAALAPFQGGHNANLVDTSTFWSDARDAYREYRDLKGNPLRSAAYSGVALPPAIASRAGSAGVGAVVGAGNAQAYNLLARDEQGQPLTPEEQHRNLILAALGGAAGGAALGPRLFENRDALGRLVQAGTGAGMDAEREALGRLLAGEGDQAARAGLTTLPTTNLDDIAPSLMNWFRRQVKQPDKFDPLVFRQEALANEAANNLSDFFATNWPTIQHGNLTRDQLLAALIPTRLSIRRGPVGEGGLAKVTQAYPELEGALRSATIQGGDDAGKVRPEDIAAYLVLNTDEGRAVARAIKDGRHGDLAPALERFKQIWPGSIMQHEGASFHDIANKLGPATDLINERGALGATPGSIAETMIGGAGDYQPIKGIARGKVPFMLGQLGAGGDNPTFDSKVIAALVKGATPNDYKLFLQQLYPWAKEDMFRAHQYFWDAVQGGASTNHTGLRAIQEATRDGGRLGAGLSPEQFDPERLRNLVIDRGQIKGDQQIAGFPQNRTDLGGTYTHPYDLQNALDEGTSAVLPGQQNLNAGVNPAAIRAAFAGLPAQVHRTLLGATRTIFAGTQHALEDTLLDPSTVAEGVRRGVAALKAAAPSQGLKWTDLPSAANSQWRAQVTTTLRNLSQDAANVALLVKEFGKDFGGVARDDVRYYTQVLRDQATNPDLAARFGDLGQLLKGAGLDHLIDPAKGLADLLGVSMMVDAATHSRAGELSLGQRALIGAGIGWGSSATKVSPVAPAWGAMRGALAPFFDAAFTFYNGVQHDAPRLAFLEGALRRDLPDLADGFLTDLANAGAPVAPLQGLGGQFTPDQLRLLAGDAAAKEWATLSEGLTRAHAERIAKLFGDFRDNQTGPVVRMMGQVFPFSTWAVKYAPVLATIAARHPVATMLIAKALVQDAENAKEAGRKGYTVGTIPLTEQTPLVGELVRARLGGQAGEVRLNPLGLLSPWGGAAISGPEDLPDSASGYERAVALLAPLGLSPHPAIQSAMYAAGQAYQPGGSLSRTAGVEELPQLLPGAAGTTIPTGRAALDQGRKVISGKGSTASDPVARRYAELVLDRTGAPLDAPQNRAYLEALGDNTDPLWQQARHDAVLKDAAGNLVSLTSPVSTSAQTASALAIAGAKKGLPYTQAQIDSSSKGVARQMQDANARYLRDNPAADAYTGTYPKDRIELLMQEWDSLHGTLKRSAPQAYAAARAAEIKRLSQGR